ncbi:hypothetical protein M422DRAFT_259335 [Sphaerobolus stellatus SS14]|uniref:Unplaced genomic scaffold SPHSTscaffold_89, whole genome shotgun sequence n=1 Tax=Sphaerobolus stellatus (strain SS14) TaxID=990650 RepID=A0A0C9VJV8_SPHS4|nr:hypothetical protein M422DRAFT_259335 [Sphaerobolus stellatus SS14]
MPPDCTSAEPKCKPHIWKPPVSCKPRAKKEENIDEDKDKEDEEALWVGNVIKMCCVLEHACLKCAQSYSSLELMQQLCMFRSHLRVTAMQTVKQMMLDCFVNGAGQA